MTENASRNRVQEAIALATAQSGVQEQLVLKRILEQRIRIKTRDIEQLQRAAIRSNTSTTGSGIQPQSLMQIAGNAANGSRLLMVARDFALQHPIATGFTLGFGLVKSPRKLLKATTFLLPIIIRFSR